MVMTMVNETYRRLLPLSLACVDPLPLAAASSESPMTVQHGSANGASSRDASSGLMRNLLAICSLLPRPAHGVIMLLYVLAFSERGRVHKLSR